MVEDEAHQSNRVVDEEDELKFCDSLTLISVSQQYEELDDNPHLSRTPRVWRDDEVRLEQLNTEVK